MHLYETTAGMSLRAVVFDFGQTLVDSADGFRQAEKDAQGRIFSNLGLRGWDEFLSTYRRIRKEFHDQSNFSRQAIWHEIYFYYCLVPDSNRLTEWEKQYWETVKNNTKAFPEAEEVLQKLTGRYQLALITNTQGQAREGIHRIKRFPGLGRFFEAIIVAGENGIPPKPAPASFRMCLDKLGVKPFQAVYVGDDWRIDICGAEKAGLRPIWIQHRSVKRSWPELETAVPIITSLDELLDLGPLFDRSDAEKNKSR